MVAAVAGTPVTQGSQLLVTSFTMNLPTGLADGDLVVAVIRHQGSGTDALAVPAGWSALVNRAGADNQRAMAIMVLPVPTASAAPASVTFSRPTTGGRYAAHLFRVTGADLAAFSGGGSTAYTAAAPAVTLTAWTAAAAPGLAVYAGAHDTVSGTPAIVGPAAWTGGPVHYLTSSSGGDSTTASTTWLSTATLRCDTTAVPAGTATWNRAGGAMGAVGALIRDAPEPAAPATVVPVDVVASTPADYEGHIGRSYGVRARIQASVNGSAFSIPVPYVRGSGAVTVSPGTGAARSLSCRVLADPDDSLVDPFTVEWQVQYGLSIGRTTTWVPVGTFVPVDVKEASRGVVEVKALDRWVRVADARFEQPRVTSGDTVAALAALLTEADSRITVDTTTAPTGTHRSSVWERDRDKAVQDLARSIGAQVRFDPAGVAVVSPVPTLAGDPFYVIARGRGGTKVRSMGGMTSRRTYNAVVVTGKSPGGDPIYAVARDESVWSRTRYGGPGMKRPRFYSSDLITTQAQADAAAVALLAQGLRVSRTLEVESLPHPGLDAGHLLDVEVRAGVWQRHLAGGFTLPLGPGTISVAAATTAADEEVEGG